MKAAAACIAVALTIAVPNVLADGLKIGYVNGFRIENESATARRAFEILKKEFTPREHQLMQQEKRIAEMKAQLEKIPKMTSPTDRLAQEKLLRNLVHQLRMSQQSFAEDLELRRREEHQRLIAAANAAIRTIAESGRYDLVVQDAVYSSPRIDITQQVLDEMAKHLNHAVVK